MVQEHFSHTALPDMVGQVLGKSVHKQVAPSYMLPEPKRGEHELSTTEIFQLLDRKQAMEMVYVPHFLTQGVLYFAKELLDYARTNRLSDFKPRGRILKLMVDEYYSALRKEMGANVYARFLQLREEYLADCARHLTVMYFSYLNAFNKAHKHVANEALYVYANIVVSLADEVERYDRSVNAKISEKLNTPCRNYGDARLTYLKRLVKSVVDEYPIAKNKDLELCMKIMINVAIRKVDMILCEK